MPEPVDATALRLIVEKAGPNHGLNVRAYPCSDGCGPGPRFIVRGPSGRIPVCMNLDELRDRLATFDTSADNASIRIRDHLFT